MAQVSNDLSSNQLSPVEASNPSVDQIEDIDITKINFEELFFNPFTQRSAWKALGEGSHLKNISDDESDDDAKKMKLRPRKPKQEKRPKISKNETTATTSPTPGTSISAVGKGMSATTTSIDHSKVSKENGLFSPIEEDRYESGCKGITELMSRYISNKKKRKRKHQSKSKAKKDLDNDSSELEELSTDGENGPSDVSNFIKYTVPHYNAKRKLCDLHYDAIRKLSPIEVENVCKQVMPELVKIQNASLSCKRHTMFLECGISKQRLREITVGRPFNSAQDRRVMDLIRAKFFHQHNQADDNGESLYYISLVLIPEALIRIFARVNQIEYELAEKEMRFEAKYDGPLPKYVLNTIPG